MSKKLPPPCCANCEKPNEKNEPLSACARCGLVSYCSRECQIQHWKNEHKSNCYDRESRKPENQPKIAVILQSSDSELCCICQEPVKQRRDRHFLCKHLFHRNCFVKCLKKGNCCPLCNKPLTEDDKICIEYIELMRNPNFIKINQLIKRIESMTQTASMLNMLGDLYLIIDQPTKAEKIFKYSEKKFPDLQVYINLAKFYTNTGQRTLARIYHEKCLKFMDSTDKNTDTELVISLNYAIFLAQSPEIPDISRDFGKLVEADNDKKLQVLEQNSDYATISPEDVEYGSMLIIRVLEIDPKNYKAYLVRAKLSSNNEEKLIYYGLAIKNDDDKSPLAHYRIATILISTNIKKANLYYNLAVKLNKNLIDERISYFLALSTSEYFTEGKQIIIEIVKDFPDNTKVKNLLQLFDSVVNF